MAETCATVYSVYLILDGDARPRRFLFLLPGKPRVRACVRACPPQAGGCDEAPQHAGAVSPRLGLGRVGCPSLSDGLVG